MITGYRILCSILMMLFSVFSIWFCVLYLLCGISDMIDGAVARWTNTATEFGSGFDTVADLIFVAVSLVKILPILHIPIWLWIWITVIAIIKIGNIIWGLVCRRKLTYLHTSMNRITGLLLFMMPLTIHFVELKYSSVLVCFAATASAIQETKVIIKFWRTYYDNKRRNIEAT